MASATPAAPIAQIACSSGSGSLKGVAASRTGAGLPLQPILWRHGLRGWTLSRPGHQRVDSCVVARRHADGVWRITAMARGQEKSKGAEQETSLSNSAASTVESVGVDPSLQSPYFGGPLLWIGVGVGLAAVFSWAGNAFKRYAMQQMFKTMASQSMGGGPGMAGMPAGNMFPGSLGGIPGMPMPPMSSGSPFPFPMPTPPKTAAAAAPPVDTTVSAASQPSAARGTTATPVEPQKTGFTFTDVNENLVVEQQEAASRAKEQASKAPEEPTRPFFTDPEVMDGGFGARTGDAGASANSAYQGAGQKGTLFSVEALERMMEDPTVQKMVYPYLPEEMRNPATFKWMMQNPQYRQQLQDMLNSMGGDGAWDNRMSDMLKNFDLNSQEVKQQFDQIGLTPEEVVAKIMANPEVAVAFQNPKVQAAIMDCSQNPMNITKYQNDKEVMDVFNKISELFPGMTGTPY
ncbi:hypothetical protein MPTK1_3g00830 [Marchantia polymorpha subsp. ruderalis]|uniref:Protein TIC 40, chloroplastic n=2 Tax=Marchantia polymorpha TaxID=3197 RepID=A0AAF6AW14_MARPO|nr:hypothetical protein MARPO_0007s0079 [Marchantia polymorpha]BBN03948.1 hypothetical protein Mp_3g00830 [Marchantia polymorpha subsp. ruderalis]|eukprot:PTQ47636.1 hypothetical protein MARPO_0007s0079 [Marchantia polymorpha]